MLEHLGMVLKFLGRPKTTCLAFTAGRGNLRLVLPRSRIVEIASDLKTRSIEVEGRSIQHEAEVEIGSRGDELLLRAEGGLLVAVFVDEKDGVVDVHRANSSGVDARMEKFLSQLGKEYSDILDQMLESVSGLDGSEDLRQLVRVFLKGHGPYVELVCGSMWHQLRTRPTQMVNRHSQRVVVDGKYLYLQMTTQAEERWQPEEVYQLDPGYEAISRGMN